MTISSSPAASVMTLPAGFCAALQSRFGERFSLSRAVCLHHGTDGSSYAPMPPDAVVYAQSTEEVAAVARLCHEYRVPLIPFGAGTSLEGHLLALHGGISLDLGQMTRIVAVHPEDLTVTVEAGVTRKQLNHALRDTGLFFPIDPGADASLGGMAATRASGTNAVRYGTMRENTLALTVVTAEGRIVHTGTRARKSSAGYDLTRIFVGSEGTLGIITEVTVKIFPQPEAVAAATCAFESVGDAVSTVIEIIQMGIPVARAEFLDASGVAAINAYSHLTLPEKPLLMFEFHGSPAAVAEQAQAVQDIAAGYHASGFEWATLPEERSRLWAARHDAFFALLQMRPGCKAISTDSCVPISRLAEAILAAKADCEASALVYSIIGHVGDGNFHTQILVDPDDPADIARAEAVNQRLVERAIDFDGTCSGEHGVGMHKIRFMQLEHGAEAVQMMVALKQAYDPLNLLNPGKMLDLPDDRWPVTS